MKNEVFYSATMLYEAVDNFVDELQYQSSFVAVPVYKMTTYKRMLDAMDVLYETFKRSEEKR